MLEQPISDRAIKAVLRINLIFEHLHKTHVSPNNAGGKLIHNNHNRQKFIKLYKNVGLVRKKMLGMGT